MSLELNGTGNGNGSSVTLTRPLKSKKPVEKPVVNESFVTFRNVDGTAQRGALSRLSRCSAIFELFSPRIVLNSSETFLNFEIHFHGKKIYSGRAVISSIVDTGIKVLCEATLDEAQWRSMDSQILLQRDGRLGKEFKNFQLDWQKFYTVSGEFKVAVADMQTFLQDLQLWLGKLELALQALPPQKRNAIEAETLQELYKPTLESLEPLFEKFETLVLAIEPDSMPAHSLFAKRSLHPLVLCAPFMHRTFVKPLGYAGDYEMVRMMTELPFQGGTIYAKLLNAFFLNTPPVVAHRNRIDVLVKHLQSESLRAAHSGRRVQIFNLGCGPAAEIQRFMCQSSNSSVADFTLLDFNNETVIYAQQTLDRIRNKNNRRTKISVFKKSVAQLIKDHSQFQKSSFDLVYCAGLFDYLPDGVCTLLLKVFYELTAPGGKVLVSNVDVCNPSQGWMECMVDWHLQYRDANQMLEIVPTSIAKDLVQVYSEPSSVNIFAEIRKP